MNCIQNTMSCNTNSMTCTQKSGDNLLLTKELDIKKKMFIGKAYSRIENEKIKELLLVTNQEHEEILAMFKNKQGEQLRRFLENTHWRLENAQYDIW